MASWKQGKIKFGFLETATSGGTLTLTASSLQYQILTGSSSHTVVLPSATTMVTGIAFSIVNVSTGSVTVKLNDASTVLITLASGQGAAMYLIDASTSNGVWAPKTGGTSSAAGIVAYAPTGTTISAGSRGLFGGNAIGPSASVEYVIMSSVSNSAAFGNLTVARGTNAAFGSSTRSVFSGGDTSNNAGTTPSSVIDYFLNASLSSAISFGNLTITRNFTSGCSNSTIGLTCGAYNGAVYTITCDQVTIATAANATNFGNFLFTAAGLAGCASTTRGLFGMSSSGNGTQIAYYTFAAASAATTFGALATSRSNGAGASSATRGLFGGGNTGSYFALIDYVTIATTGTANNFGNLTAARTGLAACASPTYAIFAGGNLSGTPSSVLDYVSIATLSNASVFGALTNAKNNPAGCSNAHGGL